MASRGGEHHMSIAQDYFNQRIDLHRMVRNEYGDLIPVVETALLLPWQVIEFEVVITVLGRWQDKRRMVRNAQGQEVVSESRVFLPVEPQWTDLLAYRGRQWRILSITEQKDMDCNTLFWEVAV